MHGKSAHQHAAKTILKSVILPANVALKRGEGCCYQVDFTDSQYAATDKAFERDQRIVRCTPTYAGHFAGVAAETYEARPYPRQVTIFEPGSVCEILCFGASPLAVAVTVGQQTCCSCGEGDRGAFSRPSVSGGRGTATILQGANAAIVVAQEGDSRYCSWSTATNQLVDDVVGTGIFAGVEVGDLVHILSGGSSSSSAAGHQAAPGVYTVTAVGDDDLSVTLSSSIATLDLTCVFFIITRGYPTVLAKLNDGEESGLQQWIQLENTAFPVSISECGTNYVGGNQKLAADVTVQLGVTNRFCDPQVPKVAFHLHGALTTADFVVAVDGAAACATYDGASPVVDFELDGNFDTLVLARLGRLIDGRMTYSILTSFGPTVHT